MSLRAPFFNSNNKTETDLASRYGSGSSSSGSSSLGSSTGTSATNLSGNTPGASSSHSPSQTIGSSSSTTSSGVREGESKLTVGPNIKLKGVEITDCDTLVVEGSVEATMDSRVIQISERGSFKGSVEIDLAEIRGSFDGNLTVRQKLIIYSTGKVTGKIRYGKVVIEEGGQLSGQIEFGATPAKASSASSTPSSASSSSNVTGLKAAA
jgi:cytoskeletal protein CcmA (bactofilin family)